MLPLTRPVFPQGGPGVCVPPADGGGFYCGPPFSFGSASGGGAEAWI